MAEDAREDGPMRAPGTGPLLRDAADLPPTLDVVEAGRWLGISRNTAYRLAKEGRFPVRTLHIGQQRRVATGDLMEYLNIPTAVRPQPAH